MGVTAYAGLPRVVETMRVLGVSARLDKDLAIRQRNNGATDAQNSEHKVVVEIDGGVHRGRADLDAHRQRLLGLTGVRFVRFSALDVEGALPAVLHRLRELLATPSPLVGEGESAPR